MTKPRAPARSAQVGELTMEPLDYSQWLQRAWNFIEQCRMLPDSVLITQIVEPPASKSRFERACLGLSRPVPRSVARWFREGSSRCHLQYLWEPHRRNLSPLQRTTVFQSGVGGEVKIGPIGDVGLWILMCESWSEPLVQRVDRRSKRALDLWQRAFPICAFGDCDMLAVIPNENGPEPVAYLIHDSPAESFVLAPDFDEFLRRWEQLCYCDQNGLCFFRQKGQLAPTLPQADRLRAWLPSVSVTDAV